MTLTEFPRPKDWLECTRERQAMQRTHALGETFKEKTDLRIDEAARKILFGQK